MCTQSRTRIVLFLMYQKWDIVPKMGHNFLPSSTPFSTSFSTSFFRLSFVNLTTIMPAFYPESRPLTSCVLFVRRRRDYYYNDMVMAYFQVFPVCQNGIKSDGRRCQKRNRIDTFDDAPSSRSMTTTAAKGANNPQKMSQFGADNATFMSQFGATFHIFQTL